MTADYLEQVRASVPAELLELPVWLFWRSLPGDKPGDKARKVPLYGNGQNRGRTDTPDDRAHLLPFEEAAAVFESLRCTGLGIALGKLPGTDLHLSGIDLDNLGSEPQRDDRVLEVMAAACSYTEISPSGNGLHILGLGDAGTTKKDASGLEVYSGGRFFTVTGRRVNGAHLADIREAANVARRLFLRTTTDDRTKPRPAAGGAIKEGGRNSSLYALGRRLADAGGLSAGEVAGVLPVLNASRCDPPLATDEVQQIARSVANGAGDWPQPANILAEAAAAGFEAGDVPPIVARYAVPWAEAAGFDPSAAIVCATVTAAAALDDRIRLEVNAGLGWWESARLWSALFTPPGGGKSPAIREMTRPLREIHRELIEDYAAAAKPGDENERPPMPATYTNDCTTEKLSEVLVDNPRGLLFVVEEFDSWIGSHDAYRNGGGKDRGEWLQLFDGGPHQIDRIKRGSFFVPNWSASLMSACTPSALKRYASKLPNDGLLQRVLPVLVRPALPAGDSHDLSAERLAWDACVRRVYGLAGGADAPSRGVVVMSEEARVAFKHYAAEYRELAQACAAYHEGLAGHVAKYGTLLARIALTFHAVTTEQHPTAVALKSETMHLAARFLARAFKHARAFYAELGGNDTAWHVARRIAASLLADGQAEVTRRDLIQSCRAFRDATPDQQNDAMKLLEDAAWVRSTEGAYAKAHPTRWLVNPAALSKFATHGELHRRRRDLVRHAIYGETNADDR